MAFSTKGVDPIMVIKARHHLGANIKKTGAAGGTPANPTDKQRKVFAGAVKDRLEGKQVEAKTNEDLQAQAAENELSQNRIHEQVNITA